MAAANEEEKNTEETGKKKGGAVKLIIIVLVLLIVLGGGGFFVVKTFFGHKDAAATAETAAPAQQEAQGGGDNPAAEQMGTLYPMETFIVNLADNDGSRYLKVTLSLELDSTEKLKEDLDTRVPQLRDAILAILSAKRYDEVSSAQGKMILKQEILRRVNSLLPKGQITNVYFTEFVAQ